MRPPILVPLSGLSPGAVLAEAVRDAAGNVLLAAGAVLTGAALDGLRRRGVAAVAVLVAEPGELTATREAQRARLDHLFRRAGAGLAATTLHRAVLAHLQEPSA